MRTFFGIGVGIAVALAGLAALHFKPWRKSTVDPARATLEVGYLPVT